MFFEIYLMCLFATIQRGQGNFKSHQSTFMPQKGKTFLEWLLQKWLLLPYIPWDFASDKEVHDKYSYSHDHKHDIHRSKDIKLILTLKIFDFSWIGKTVLTSVYSIFAWNAKNSEEKFSNWQRAFQAHFYL